MDAPPSISGNFAYLQKTRKNAERRRPKNIAVLLIFRKTISQAVKGQMSFTSFSSPFFTRPLPVPFFFPADERCRVCVRGGVYNRPKHFLLPRQPLTFPGSLRCKARAGTAKVHVVDWRGKPRWYFSPVRELLSLPFFFFLFPRLPASELTALGNVTTRVL